MRVSVRTAVAAALLAAAAAGSWSCGSAEAPLSVPSPAPTPVTSRALIHVLDTKADTIHAYEVAADTGRLRVLATTPAAGAKVIAADPQGRPLYTWSPFPHAAIRSHFVDVRDGALALLEERTLEIPRPPGQLMLSAERVLAWDSYHWGRHITSWLSAYERRPDGAWVCEPEPDVDTRYDVELRLFASPQSTRVVVLTDRRWLRTYVPTPGGEFEPLGAGFDVGDAAQTGFDASIEAYAGAIAGEQLVLSGYGWHGGQPRPVLASFAVGSDGTIRGEALADNALRGYPTSAGSLLLVATSDGWLAQLASDGIRLFRVDGSGAISAAESLPAGPAGAGIAFHPSGQFLYVSMAESLVTYHLENGSWVPFASDPGVPAGPLVVTLP